MFGTFIVTVVFTLILVGTAKGVGRNPAVWGSILPIFFTVYQFTPFGGRLTVWFYVNGFNFNRDWEVFLYLGIFVVVLLSGLGLAKGQEADKKS